MYGCGEDEVLDCASFLPTFECGEEEVTTNIPSKVNVNGRTVETGASKDGTLQFGKDVILGEELQNEFQDLIEVEYWEEEIR